MEIKSEVPNPTWPLSAVSPQSSLFPSPYNVHVLRNSMTDTNAVRSWVLVLSERFLTGGLGGMLSVTS